MLQLRAAPPTEQGNLQLPPDFRVFWKAFGGGVIDGYGLYRAPFVVPPPGATVRIVLARGVKGALDSAETTVDLEPGAVPGAEDCLGTGQEWSSGGRGLEYASVDELPNAVTTIKPDYPRSVAARGLKGGLIVNVVVCKNGRVLDAVAQWGVGSIPIPELETLAVAAAKQWVFKPAAIAGQPVAAMVAIPFVFPPH